MWTIFKPPERWCIQRAKTLRIDRKKATRRVRKKSIRVQGIVKTKRVLKSEQNGGALRQGRKLGRDRKGGMGTGGKDNGETNNAVHKNSTAGHLSHRKSKLGAQVMPLF